MTQSNGFISVTLPSDFFFPIRSLSLFFLLLLLWWSRVCALSIDFSRIELNGFILQIHFDNNILWNSSPHPNYSGRRYRWNQMKKENRQNKSYRSRFELSCEMPYNQRRFFFFISPKTLSVPHCQISTRQSLTRILRYKKTKQKYFKKRE